MRNVAILGSGDLAATLARRLAECELARRVALVDPNEGRARGKALDLMQSAPVEGYDVVIEGAPDLKAAGRFDVLFIADHPALEEPSLSAARASELIASLLPSMGEALLVVAALPAAPLVEAAWARGLPRERAMGSAPVALASALVRHLASELSVEPRQVSATVIGHVPGHLLLPQGAATVGGVPVERLSPTAARRALAAVTRHTPGPVSLAAAAAAVLRALQGVRPSVLPVTVVLQGEYGHRGMALAVPALLGGGRLQSVLEVALEPVDRVALDNAAARGGRSSH